MKVLDLLRSKGSAVSTTYPEARVSAVLERFTDEAIGSLVVTTTDRTIVGLVAERDIVQALGKRGAEILDLDVSEIMHAKPVTCTPEDDMKSVMKTMTQRRLRHLPVAEAGRLVGILSIGDIVKNRLDEMELESNVLRDMYIANR